MWLTCMVIKVHITTIWVEGSPHVWLEYTVINVQGNKYYSTMWWRGALTCGSHAW